jgi:hypothetical protein
LDRQIRSINFDENIVNEVFFDAEEWDFDDNYVIMIFDDSGKNRAVFDRNKGFFDDEA